MKKNDENVWIYFQDLLFSSSLFPNEEMNKNENEMKTKEIE